MSAFADLGTPVPNSSQKVTITTTSNASTTISGVVAVRVVSTVDCYIEVGANPSASFNNSMFLPAYTPEYIRLPGPKKIATIQNSIAGTLYITPLV